MAHGLTIVPFGLITTGDNTIVPTGVRESLLQHHRGWSEDIRWPRACVPKVEGGRIKLTKQDSGQGSHKGHHHFIAKSLVAGVEGNAVRLSANADAR